jgi:hypothetical protein
MYLPDFKGESSKLASLFAVTGGRQKGGRFFASWDGTGGNPLSSSRRSFSLGIVEAFRLDRYC